MHTKVFSDDEQIRRVWDMEEVKDLMARRAYLYMQDLRREELETLWVQKPENRETAVFGSNWGFYLGLDNISAWYVGAHGNLRQTQLDAISKNDPSVKNIPENLGYGSMIAAPLSTALVEIAGDGKTAQGLWYSIGQRTDPNGDGTATAHWVCGKIGADFMKEDGIWKIWRVVEAPDIIVEPGTAVADHPVFWEEGENLMENLFGTPTLPMTAHDPTFNWSDDFPHAPKAYYSYDPKNGCCPEGVQNDWRPY